MSLDQSLSDEDIFWGPMTFKEVKRRLFGQTREIPCHIRATTSHKKDESSDTSVKILQSHSEPNLIIKHNNNSENITRDSNLAEDDSFVQLENMVEKLCVSPTLADLKQTQELNNTLDVIEYILNNPPKTEGSTEVVTDRKQDNVEHFGDKHSVITKKSPENKSQSDKITSELPVNTLVKSENKVIKKIVYNTPQSVKPKPVFKTPSQSHSKRPFTPSLMRTPSNSNAFQHIVSPVASYIKNTPSVALVKDSHQKKSMTVSLIPKLKNNLPVKSSNKENNFTPGAYKIAKKIKVIDTEEQRLPHRHGVKSSTLPKPLVQTHNHRVLNRLQKNPLQQEDSVADLSVHQAELSVYMQKYASKTDK